MPAAPDHAGAGDRQAVLSIHRVFKRQKSFAEHCLSQLDDHQMVRAPDDGANSPAVIVRHMAGNMLSRWTDPFTTDGEKPWRNRESEFEAPPGDPVETRAETMRRWEQGWSVLFGVLDGCTDADLGRSMKIRNEPYTLLGALARGLDHLGYHVGQISTLAKQYVGRDRWRYFTVPPGESEAFNRAHGL